MGKLSDKKVIQRVQDENEEFMAWIDKKIDSENYSVDIKYMVQFQNGDSFEISENTFDYLYEME